MVLIYSVRTKLDCSAVDMKNKIISAKRGRKKAVVKYKTRAKN